MTTKNPRGVRVACAIILAGALGSWAEAGPRQAAPRASRPASHAVAMRHGGASLSRSVPPGVHASAPRVANGVARYGYGHGGGSGFGYPYWGGYYPYWGWSGWWCLSGWWDWPGYAEYVYGPWYGPGVGSYDAEAAEPPRGPAEIETDVSPSRAEVVLDGEAVGFAADYDGRWDELQVTPGKHTIAFRSQGYRTLTIELEASPAMHYEFNDVLVRGEGEDHRTIAAPPTSIATRGRLKVSVQPTDAAVYLDGEYLGSGNELARTHGAIPVITGTHRLEAVRPGYASQVRTVEVGETDVAAVDLKLEHER